MKKMKKLVLISMLMLIPLLVMGGSTLNKIPYDPDGYRGAVPVDDDGDKADFNSDGTQNFLVQNSSTTPGKVALYLWNGSKWVEAATESATSFNLKVSVAESTNAVDIALLSADNLGTGIYAFTTRSMHYGYDDTNNKWHRMRADRILKVPKTISVIHSEVHDGHMYNSSYVWEALADDATGVFLVDTSTKNAHAVINITTGGNALVKMWEGVVVDSSGTALAEINMNGQFPDTPMANIYHTPENADPTTLIYSAFIGGGAGVGASTTASGGVIRVDTEWIFKKNELYIISVENESGGATLASIVIEWYEEEDD